jgi:DNA-binding NarL/FixJ family response regulator
MTSSRDDSSELLTDDSTNAVVRVVVVDDHPGVRRGVCELLETGDEFAVVGQAVDGRDALSVITIQRPDVVLMDVSMPVLDGLAATKLLLQQPGSPAVVLFTACADRVRLGDALASGAVAFILKDASAAELRETLRRAARRGR